MAADKPKTPPGGDAGGTPAGGAGGAPDATAALKAKVAETNEAMEKVLDENADLTRQVDVLTKILNRAAGKKPAADEPKKKRSGLRKFLLG